MAPRKKKLISYKELRSPRGISLHADNSSDSICDFSFIMSVTYTFPHEKPDWNNLSIIHKNTLPPRAAFCLYDTPEAALTRDVLVSKTQSLSGTWQFSIANSPFDAPADFQEPGYNLSTWGTIEVPGMWQLQGYGRGPK